jgi:DNA-binding transcriptional MerR regulator
MSKEDGLLDGEGNDAEAIENEEDLHTALAAAFEEAEAAEGTEPTEPKAAAEPTEPVEPKEPTEPTEPTEPVAPVTSEPNIDKAPASWSPADREHWAALPESVKRVTMKREAEIQRTLQDTATARKTAEQFQRTIEPYQAMFAARGAKNSIEGIQAVLHTAAQIQNGTQDVKAKAVAQLVKDFGVSIKDLDNALVGQPVTQQTPASDPRYDQMASELAQVKQYFSQQDQQQQSSVQEETNKFLAETEFATDVRQEMGDFMELYGRRNQKLSLKEAYNLAINSRPDIQEVIKNRSDTTGSKERIAKARQAGVSLPSQSSTQGGATAPPKDLRSAIANAWDSA